MSKLPVSIGEYAAFTKTVGESDIYGFAGITGDFAAPHVNEAFMEKSQYGTRVAHGALLVGFMSTASALLATRIIQARDDLTPMSIGYDRVRFTEAVIIQECFGLLTEARLNTRSLQTRTCVQDL